MASIPTRPSIPVAQGQHQKPIASFDRLTFQPQSTVQSRGKLPSLSLGQDLPRSWRAASRLGAEEAVVEEVVKEVVENALHVSRRKQSDDARHAEEEEPRDEGVSVETRYWTWKGHQIRYLQAGTEGPAVLMIHGFGANSDHWRYNIPVLARSHRVFAIDLLGYGYSSKPTPPSATSTTTTTTTTTSSSSSSGSSGSSRSRDDGAAVALSAADESPYRFENWGQQALDFLEEVVQERAFLLCNSVGGIVGLQAAVLNPSLVRSLLLLNISVRMLHVSKQAWFQRPVVSLIQSTLRNTSLGKQFFSAVATPRAVGNILRECYADPSRVDDQLVDLILKPGLQPGAVDVFLDFICYSGGPLPEELLQQVKCPVWMGWGCDDPWEPLAAGRELGKLPSVERFVELAGVGHCPQDEAPGVVNSLAMEMIRKFKDA